jgi:hypothetical protein
VLRFEQIAVEGETAASRPPRLQSYVANGDTYARNARRDCNPVATDLPLSSRDELSPRCTHSCVKPTTHQAKRVMRIRSALSTNTIDRPGFPLSIAASAAERRPGSIDMSATNGSFRIHLAGAIVLHEGQHGGREPWRRKRRRTRNRKPKATSGLITL